MFEIRCCLEVEGRCFSRRVYTDVPIVCVCVCVFVNVVYTDVPILLTLKVGV